MQRPGYTALAFLFIVFELNVLYFAREFGWSTVDTILAVLTAPLIAGFCLAALGLVIALPAWLLYKGFSK